MGLGYESVHLRTIMYVWMYGCMEERMYVWMDGWMDGWKEGCMYVCMYVRMYVCMYVCMYVVCMCVCYRSCRLGVINHVYSFPLCVRVRAWRGIQFLIVPGEHIMQT